MILLSRKILSRSSFFHHCIVFATALFSVLRSDAQQYSFIQYSLKEGLVQSQVRCLYEDSRGYLWAGTLGGLSRFDGREFLNWDIQDGLTSNQVSCIVERHDGTIVIGTVGGISLLDATGIRSVQLPQEWKESTVNALIEDNQHRLWIGTENGLCYFDGKTILPEDQNSPLATSHIKSFHLWKNDEMLVTAKDKIYLVDNVHITTFYDPQNPDINFFDLDESADGSIFLATKGSGLVKITPEKKVISYNDTGGLDATTITGIFVDANAYVWISSRFGFYKFTGDKFTAFTEKNGLRTPDIRDIITDREGNVWLATYGSGLLKLAGEAFVSYTTSEGLSSDAIMSITQDNEGALWFSTFDQGICRLHNDSIISYDITDLTGNNRIWSSICDKNGELWFGSSDGLLQFDGQHFRRYTESDSLNDRMVLSLFEDNVGRLIAGTAKGICYLSGDVFKPLPGTREIETRVRAVRQDRLGNFWLATRDGVYRCNGSMSERFDESHGLPGTSTYSIEVDPYNRIWVGTQNGIALYSSGKFKPLQVGNTAGSNTINFIKFHDDKIWLGTNNGLYYFRCTENLDPEEIQFNRSGIDDGLRSLETNLNAVYVDRNQFMWFGSPEGVMRMDARALNNLHLPVAPRIHLTKIQLNLQDQNWADHKSVADPISGLPAELKVKYKNNHFTFYFTGISLTYPEDVVYQYMLEGFDTEWQAITDADFATYSNLPYNDFIFRVRARNKQEVWSDTESFSFTILPPVWLTWWFIMLEIIVVAGIAVAIYYSRKKIITARFEKEKSEMRARMLALEQQSLNSSMNRHFIFNALNSIQYYINRQDRLAANRYLSDFAKLIRKNLDSSQENLTTLREEIERLELYLRLEHMRFKDKFEYTIQVDETLDQDSIRVPAMLLQPFLENSIWHGLLPMNSPGKVVIDISRNNGTLEFTITDNGIGIENSLKNKSGLDNHISKGMEITSGRIDLIRQMTSQQIELLGPYQLHDHDQNVSGTEVKIKVPVDFR